jgi:sulfite exporter TauE/SafE
MTGSETRVFFFIVMGILLTLLGVGGVENSITDVELLQSLAVSALGLLLMWVATLMIRREI